MLSSSIVSGNNNNNNNNNKRIYKFDYTQPLPAKREIKFEIPTWYVLLLEMKFRSFLD